MKAKVKKILLFLGLSVIVISCNKVDRVIPKNFIEKPIWNFEELKIGYDNVGTLPYWDIDFNSSYGDYKIGTWCHADGSKSKFIWKFNNTHDKLEFKNKPLEYGEKETVAYIQCYNLSGTYSVITNKKGLFEFESHKTNGYIGPRIYIRIE